jgi:hypothetical protein
MKPARRPGTNGDVEAVHPHHRLGAAGMDVAVPGPAGDEDEITRFHWHADPVDDHADTRAWLSSSSREREEQLAA